MIRPNVFDLLPSSPNVFWCYAQAFPIDIVTKDNDFGTRTNYFPVVNCFDDLHSSAIRCMATGNSLGEIWPLAITLRN